MTAPTLERVIEAVQTDDGTGFCLNCGAEQEGCEPDARNYICHACDEATVFGAEECLLIVAV